MRNGMLGITFCAICALGSQGAETAAPQTARQALLEMFFSKAPGTLVKHLPAATVAALEKSGAMNGLQQYSLLATQMQTQGTNLQTFETGSVLLSGENPKTGAKIEVMVEKDTLRGEDDDLELSFLTYKDGQAQRIPFMPRMTFSMKQENQVWKLNEVAVTIRVPLADPELLKMMTEKMTPQLSATSTNPGTFTARPQNTAMQVGTDAAVMAAMKTILTAETTYAATYARVGYTCMLSDLDGFGGGEPNEHQAMLINSGLASGKKYGFVFTLSGCSGNPATSFHLSVSPNANTFGRKAFCADQSGTIRQSPDANLDRCWGGQPAQ